MRISTGLVLAALLALMAGCGQTAAPVATTKTDQSGLKFAQCMRDHGVDIPDPQDNGQVQIRLPAGVDPQKAQAATEQCRQYLPNGGQATKADPQAVEQQRAFAQCMREHGVDKFPDPDANGGFQIGPGTGLSPDDPKMKAAQQECAKLRPSGAPTQTTGSNG